jgi:hypothetical protein
LLEESVAATQLPQVFSLFSRDPVQATIFDVCLARPVGQRCRGNTEIGSDFVSWFFAIPGNFYYVTAELFGECSHDNDTQEHLPVFTC